MILIKCIRLYRGLIPFNWKSLLVVVLMIISALISFIIPYINGKIIDTIVNKNIHLFIFLIVSILLLYITSNLFNFISEQIIIKIQYNIINKYKKKFLYSALESSLDYRETITASEFQTRFNEINNISYLISTNIYKLIISFIVMILIYGYILMFSRILFIAIIIIMFIYYRLNSKAFQLVNTQTTKVMEENVKLSQKINTFFKKLDFINNNNLVSYVNKSINMIYTTSDQQKKMKKNINISSNSISFLNNFFLVITTLIIGILIMKNNLSIGNFLTLTQYMAYIFVPLTLLSTTNITIQPGIVSYDRTMEFIEILKKNKKHNGYMSINSIEKIEILNPKYKNRISKNYCITAKPGDKISIRGKNGDGKSTLLKLIYKSFDDFPNNTIKINDIDIKNINMSSITKMFHYCPQQILLLDTTVKNNILIEIEKENYDSAMQLLENDRNTNIILKNLELSKNVDVDSNNLSLGEQKKIALLRLALTTKKVILIDELDASLDKEGKKLLDKILENKKESIIFEISHISKNEKKSEEEEGRYNK